MSTAEHLTQAQLSRRGRAVHPLAAVAERAEDGAARRRRGRRRHGAAIGGTLLHPEIVNYTWIIVAVVVGTAIGSAAVARAADGGAAADRALARVRRSRGRPRRHGRSTTLWLQGGELTTFRMGAIGVEVILGYLTFTGSLMAAGKLQEMIPTRPITYRGQNIVNLALLAIAVGAAVVLLLSTRDAGSCSRRSSCCRWSSACC